MNLIEEQTENNNLIFKKLSPIDLKKASNSQIEIHICEYEENNNTAEQLFNNERVKWNNEMQILYTLLSSKNYSEFPNLQSKTLSTRQLLQESITGMMQKLAKANSSISKATGERIEYYAIGHGLRVSDGTRTKLIDRDLSERKRYIELLETHIEYLRECRNGCDQIGYAVKNLVGLIAYLSIK